MFRKRTEIVLSERNYAALMFAAKMLKDQFDSKASVIRSTLRKPDSAGSYYEVEIEYSTPRWSSTFTDRILRDCRYTVFVSFNLSEEKPFQGNGEVRLWPAESGMGFRFDNGGSILFLYSDGVCEVPEETRGLIDEFYTRIREYLPEFSAPRPWPAALLALS